MKTIFRPIAIFLIPLLLIHFLILSPGAAYAERKNITPVPPESVEEIFQEPVAAEAVKPFKKGISGWWYVLGFVIISGVVAAISSSSQEKEKPKPIYE